MPLCVQDYSCVSKRARTVKVVYRPQSKGKVTDLVIDSTGLKIFGEGEWKVRKNGAEKRRVWRKLHLAVDPATHDIVAAEMSLDNVHDAEVLPTLLNPERRKLGHIYADGAYDSKASHQLIVHKGATACIPPRKNAGLWEKGNPRNEAVLVMRKEGLAHWKKISGYHRRSQRRRLQLSCGGNDGVCERNKQTEHPWSVCQKDPSVAVTWGWGSCVLTADLGNNALIA